MLEEKIKELKDMCLKESEVTGELPHEYTMFMSPGEKTPTIKKRIGTGFSIAGKFSASLSCSSKCVTRCSPMSALSDYQSDTPISC